MGVRPLLQNCIKKEVFSHRPHPYTVVCWLWKDRATIVTRCLSLDPTMCFGRGANEGVFLLSSSSINRFRNQECDVFKSITYELYLHKFDLIWSSVDCLEYSSTTENRRLAQCQKHSAKREKQSAKPLLSVTLGEHHLVKADLAKLFLPSVFYRALEKHFCWVLNWHLAKNFWKIKIKKHPPPACPPPPPMEEHRLRGLDRWHVKWKKHS